MTDYGYGEAQLQTQLAQQQAAADAEWKKALAANAGGHTGAGGFSTNFESAGGLLGLRKMIDDADPEAMHTTSASWTNIQGQLTTAASDLGTHVSNCLEGWTGQTADAFRANAQQLHLNLVNGSKYAENTSSALTDAALALSEAKASMPSPPSEWSKFSRAMTSERTDQQFKQDAAAHSLDWAVQHDGSQLSADEQAHQQAVVVMEKLGTKYNTASAKLAQTPPPRGETQEWPPPPTPPPPPVTQPGGSVPKSPGSSGVPGGGDQDGGKVRAIEGGVTPASPGKFPVIDDTPPDQDVNGGVPITPVTGPAGSELDGAPGGPTSGFGDGTGGSGVGGYGGTVGVGAGGGGGGLGGGGAYGGVGGLGFGGGAGAGGEGGLGRYGSGSRGLGRLGGGLEGEGMAGGGVVGEGSGLLGESAGGAEPGSAMAENEAGIAARERAAAGAAGGESGSGAGSGMGMGGMGGAGRSNNKKKRKSRAAYLVEDEETWSQEDAPNPPVIS